MMEVNENKTPQQVLEDLKKYFQENPDVKFQLVYVDYRESLSANMLQSLFRSPEDFNEAEDELREAYADNEDDAAERELKDIIGADDYDVLEEDDELFREAKNLIQEHDESDTMKDLFRNTYNVLMRYRLHPTWYDFPVGYGPIERDNDPEENIRLLAEMFHVSPEQFHDKMDELLANASYGGSPEFIWYGDPRPFYDALQEIFEHGNLEDGGWPTYGTITFEDPHALVIDNLNGSGHDVRLEGVKVTLPFDPKMLVIDEAKGNGYGWNKIAGVYKPAYKADVTWNEPD